VKLQSKMSMMEILTNHQPSDNHGGFDFARNKPSSSPLFKKPG
jgi:hypothetical protein